MEAANSNSMWNQKFLQEMLVDPRIQADNMTIRAINEMPSNSYSFVCNTIYKICSGTEDSNK